MREVLDEQIRSMVVELVESSPPPWPASTVLGDASPRPADVRLRSGLVQMGLVAAAVLLAGLAGAWIGRNLLPPADVAPPPVVDGMPAPEPGFSTADFGEEVSLLSSSGDVRPDVDPGTLDGEVVAVGRIEDTDVEVFTWATTDVANGRCLQIIGSGLRERTCSGGIESRPDFEVLFSRARFDQNTREPIDVIAVWRVPDGTSIVRVSVDGEVISWQRPVAGTAAFTFDPGIALVMLEALDTKGDLIRGIGLSPLRVANPIDNDADIDDVDIIGRWHISGFEIDGQSHAVVVGVNAELTPVIRIREDIAGFIGCNSVRLTFTLDGNRLSPGEFSGTIKHCGSDLMAVENAFHRLIASEVLRVDVVDGVMVWSAYNVTMSFEIAD